MALSFRKEQRQTRMMRKKEVAFLEGISRLRSLEHVVGYGKLEAMNNLWDTFQWRTTFKAVRNYEN